MGLPYFPGCKNCGDEPTVLQTYQPTNCSDPNTQDPCVSQKGKFHDKLTEDFIVPQVGNQVKMFVCDGSLWAKAQWVAVENGTNKIAVYPIMATGNKTITVMNGCISGEEIFGNPDPGKLFSKGTVIFPVAPQGCESNFCERVAEAIRTCGAEGLYDLLKETDQLCFTNTSELGEAERGHLFAGTMPDPCNCPTDYGYGIGEGTLSQDPENLWRSCLRKLTKIWTNLGGRSICFADLPQYNKLNDPNKKGRDAVLDQNGCLAKGDSLYACEESLDVSTDGADAISVCSNGEKKVLIAECNTEIVGCCDEDDENPKWKRRPKGLSLYMLDEPIEVHMQSMPIEGENAGTAATLPASINITKSFEEILLPDACGTAKRYAFVDFFWKTSNTTAQVAIDIFYNDEFYRKLMTNDSANEDISAYTFQDVVPLDAAIPNQLKFRATRVQGEGTYRSLVRILGFYA